MHTQKSAIQNSVRSRGTSTLTGHILGSPVAFNALNNRQFRNSLYTLFYDFIHSRSEQLDISENATFLTDFAKNGLN